MNARRKPAAVKPLELEPIQVEGKIEESGTAIARAPQPATTPAQLVAMAVEQGADVDKLERLLAMQERWEANEARKAYTEALVAFKSEALTIAKSKHVHYKNKQGGFTDYDHAELHNVVDIVVPALARHGIAHSWSVKQDGPRISVGCTLTHRLGHRETVEMSAGADDSGGKNSIQAIGSTKTYLERYTLLAATGLATGGALPGPSDDDDGQGAEGAQSGPDFSDLDEDPRQHGPQDGAADKAERRRLQCVEAEKRNQKQVEAIRAACSDLDLIPDDAKALERLAEAWNEITQADQMALWLAPTKGGVLTILERKLISERVPKANAADAEARRDV